MGKNILQKGIASFVLILIHALLATVSAQNIVVSGKITDSGNYGIPYARILVKSSKLSFVADSLGQYSFEHKPGKHTFIVSSLGYASVNQIVEISETDLSVDFVLSSVTRQLKELDVIDQKQDINGLRRLADVENMAIYAGKKNEVIVLQGLNANLATNNARQIYARVPGVNIVENDSYGIQLGVATRGLNPNRTTEFNSRQNGYDISADPIGYPESYYTPPAEAISRIEIVRGAASLQYGTQFGGLLNFQFRKGNSDKKFELDSRQTLGTYGLFNSFNAIGGQIGKLNYYAFYQHKQGDGWRDNTNFNLNTGYAALSWDVASKLKIGAELTMMDYLMKQPGGLTDVQFEENPRASYRNGNWFKAKWLIPAFHADYQITEKTKLNLRTYGLIAQRGSIGNIINPLRDKTDTTNRRQLTYDHYNNWGTEIRLLHRYKLAGKVSSFLAGARYFQGNTHKMQGSGFEGKDANFNFPDSEKVDEFDYLFPSHNLAFFAENVLWLNEKWSITPGFRLEYINTNSKGYSVAAETNAIVEGREQKTRSFPLFGIGVNHAISPKSEIYFNISQNYSPVNYSDIQVRTPNFQVDPNLKDVTGFNADLGFRGQFKNWLNFDLSSYYLDYNNRIGIIRKASDDGLEVIRYRTNVGRSRSRGVEAYGEVNFFRFAGMSESTGDLSFFASVAYTDAAYTKALNPLLTTLIVGKQVEFAPKMITRAGLTYKKGRFGTTLQLAYTSEQYTDAYNSLHTSDGLVGEILAYKLVDWTANYQLKKLSFSLSVNNVLNEKYFTRRALGFPGPGIIPSDGTTAYLTVGLKL
ncbi:carboxypeptidase-like regulatory domain-containing protein [Dyadobacter sp. NIV53]|uniref:carboxypeptidase-like regulatory domain-containing protein n=1 Tax=Dyadobacter sp. NIV53 TaxID=2861765 RepID=UPI001C876C8B|nr:carboxypeptidase-like regulatory domain-containing protein [Dyadobacter sp. NIV53]